MGTSVYKGGASRHRSLSDNIKSVTRKYPISGGYFGSKGKSKDSRVRNIVSDNAQNTAKDFFNKIGYGGKYQESSKKGVSIVKLHDGTIITHRVTSSSDGTPAVSINITKSTDGAGIKIQKIHFVGKE